MLNRLITSSIILFFSFSAYGQEKMVFLFDNFSFDVRMSKVNDTTINHTISITNLMDKPVYLPEQELMKSTYYSLDKNNINADISFNKYIKENLHWMDYKLELTKLESKSTMIFSDNLHVIFDDEKDVFIYRFEMDYLEKGKKAAKYFYKKRKYFSFEIESHFKSFFD